jgi:TolA-binding protein
VFSTLNAECARANQAQARVDLLEETMIGDRRYIEQLHQQIEGLQRSVRDIGEQYTTIFMRGVSMVERLTKDKERLEGQSAGQKAEVAQLKLELEAALERARRVEADGEGVRVAREDGAALFRWGYED